MPEENAISDTSPIRAHVLTTPGHDRFGHDVFARQTSQNLSGWRRSTSLVVALSGARGTGKSSLVKLIGHHFSAQEENGLVAEFNPSWLIDEASLARQLCNEIRKPLQSASANETAARCLRSWDMYTGQLCQISASSDAGQSTREEGESLSSLRKRLIHSFSQMKSPLLVLIDDIDRLSDTCIRNLIHFLKAHSDLPNVIYLLTYQKERVESPLSNTAGSGFSALDNLVQINLKFPGPTDKQLKNYFHEMSGSVFGEARICWDRARYQTVFDDLIWPLLKTPADIDRIRDALQFRTPSLVSGDWLAANAIDLLLIAVLQHFFPSAHEIAARAFNGKKDTLLKGMTIGNNQQTRLQETVKEFLNTLETARDDKRLIDGLLNELFPQLQKTAEGVSAEMTDWEENLRICHPTHFHKYFASVPTPEDLDYGWLNDIVSEDNDHQAILRLFTARLEADNDLATLLDQIRELRLDLSQKSREAVAIALLNLSDALPENSIGAFSQTDPLGDLISVVISLVSAVEDLEKREALFRKILSTSTSPTGVANLYWHAEPEGERRQRSREFVRDVALEGVRGLVVQRLKDSLSKADFLDRPYAGRILDILEALMGSNFESFMKGTMANFDKSQSAAFLLARLDIRELKSGRDSARVYQLVPKRIESFIPIREFLKTLPAKGTTALQAEIIKTLKEIYKASDSPDPDQACYLFSERNGEFEQVPADGINPHRSQNDLGQ